MQNLTRHWAARLRSSNKPAYLLIPEMLAEDLASGRLSPGDRLPPLRDLARALDLNYTTVARGVAEARKRGHVDARPGRGSFLRAAAPALQLRDGTAAEMTMNLPPEPDDAALLQRMAAGCQEMYADPRRLQAHLRYQDFGGSAADRDAGARWLSTITRPTTPDCVLVGPGIHGVLCGLLSLLARPGDTVCVESVSYPGIKALTTQLGIKLHALPVDQEGPCPQHFEEACKHLQPKALYCNPTMLNPTSVTMSRARREAMADIALRYAIPIIEDDAYGALPLKSPTTLAELAPELTYYVTGLAKCLGAGLRVAYVRAPTTQATHRVAGALRSLSVMAAPPMVALATQWINNGTVSAVVQAIRKETNSRHALMSKHLSDWEVWSQAECFHAWLRLPDTLSPNEAAAFWRSRGVAAVASTAFATNTQPPRSVRLCLGGPTTLAQFEQSLRVVADVLRHPQQVHASVM